MRTAHLSTATLLLMTLALACEEGRKPPAPPNNNNNNQQSACGNGRLDPGETCDSAVPTSSVGACPAKCIDGVACTVDRMLGAASACNVACAFDPISVCLNDDGCCPEGCTAASDNDCSVTCGNARLDRGETCDGDCPAGCDDQVACTTDTTYGAASTCSLACGYRAVSSCANGDGCCPAGCTPDNDGDCSRSCGNGQRDLGETCDGDCPASCDDQDACTVDVTSGSRVNCNLACSQQRIRTCTAGDGCCPGGCTQASDADCPSSCEVVTACSGGDGCCPTSCTQATDADCPPPVGGGIGAACASMFDCTGITTTSPDCLLDGWPGGYCTFYCTSEECPSGSHCDIESFRCIDDCNPADPGDCRTGYGCTTGLDKTERPFTGCYPG